MTIIYNTREEWLNAAVEELRPFFSAYSHTLPAEIRVATGYPTNAKRSGFKVLGQCIPSTNSADGHFEVLISPQVDNTHKVVEVLIAQLACTAKGASNQATKAYDKVAQAMHIIPSGTASNPYYETTHNSAFVNAYGAIIQSLGAYPHAAVDMAVHKTQGTRLLLCVCPTCGCKVRMTAKWTLNAHGDLDLPTCRCGDLFNLA